MIVREWQDYWTFLKAHRKGNKDALVGLEIMSYGDTKIAAKARQYLRNLKEAS